MDMMRKFFSISLIILFFSSAASGIYETTFNDVKKPNGAILFIVDGLGSSYFYTELTPFSLDGKELLKAKAPNLTFGTRILNIKTPHPVTGLAHSTIVTGFSDADEEIVGYPEATIYDVTRKYGFVNIAVMEKGDFLNMRNEQDIILFAENNSIDEPLMSIQARASPPGIYELMFEWKIKIPSYLGNRSGVEKYSAYNKWGIDTADSVAAYILKNHPTQKFLITVNVGAIDSGGHNLGDDDYVKLIEDLDRDFYPLFKTASENNVALFFTADHGMSFSTKNARRGGHSSEKYSSRNESLKIPLVIISPNIKSGLLKGEYGQEDIAPTLLSVLDIPNPLKYSDGSSINVKEYASLFIKADKDYQVSLWTEDQKIMEQQDSELILSGLSMNTNYTIKASSDNSRFEERMFLDSDKHLFLKRPESGLKDRSIIVIVSIMIVNATGLLIIRKIKD